MPTDVSDVICHLDELLDSRGMTLSHLSELVDISLPNLSILKNNKAKAIRFTTLTAICKALDCEIGELLTLKQ
ncbi:helix-turn-helix domain-containing protein [Rothia nasimurium]|uniref:helix-turn-helix domain-containing protein n=1 Tax=Rothia nasimurium TaxID=85336 RepID=UPI003B9DE5A2